MQTGHPTLATFHATDATTLIQRLGAPPILVPMTFMDNLNVALFQESRVVNNRRVRRVTRIVEIAGSGPEGVVAIRFNPDGFFDEASVSRISILQGEEDGLQLVPDAMRLGYEILPLALE